MANLLMLLAGAVLCLEWLIDPAWAWWIMAQTVALFAVDLWWSRRKYRLQERNYSTNMDACPVRPASAMTRQEECNQ